MRDFIIVKRQRHFCLDLFLPSSFEVLNIQRGFENKEQLQYSDQIWPFKISSMNKKKEFQVSLIFTIQISMFPYLMFMDAIEPYQNRISY